MLSELGDENATEMDALLNHEQTNGSSDDVINDIDFDGIEIVTVPSGEDNFDSDKETDKKEKKPTHSDHVEKLPKESSAASAATATAAVNSSESIPAVGSSSSSSSAANVLATPHRTNSQKLNANRDRNSTRLNSSH